MALVRGTRHKANNVSIPTHFLRYQCASIIAEDWNCETRWFDTRAVKVGQGART